MGLDIWMDLATTPSVSHRDRRSARGRFVVVGCRGPPGARPTEPRPPIGHQPATSSSLSPRPPAKQQQRQEGATVEAMARLLLPQCCCGGLTPLSLPRRAVALPPPPALLPASPSRRALSLPAASRRALSLRVAVAAPTRLVTAEDDGSQSPSQAAPAAQDGPSGGFDPAAPPPFGLAEIRAAIPKHCWAKDPWRSMGYVVRDVVVVLALAAAAARLDSWLAWPVYWAAQGTMFWALFVLGHDCGHGSFSNNTKLNSVVGHILHSSILVPYNGWRISHRTHHQNHGHVEKDESWHPLPEKLYRSLDSSTRTLRFGLPFPMLAYPFYLWSRSPGKSGSHFHPSSDLFQPNEKKDVLTSTTCWLAMAGLLAALTVVMGPLQILKLYAVPYWIFVMWLDFVTYLHHHGHNDKLPWYRGKEWSYLRGGLTTLDRDYGWLNNVHHDIGTHVIHHLFPQIPHYHLVEATEAAKPVLGKYYREPDRSGPFPFHLFGALARSMKRDHYVSDTGDIIYYQTDPKITGAAPTSD